MAKWQGDKLTKIALTKFGASYKRLPTFEQELKASAPLQAGDGKEATGVLFSSIVGEHALSIAKMSTSWNSASWMHGYAPTYSHCGLTPNSAATLKIQVLGEMEVVAMNLVEVLAAFNGIDDPQEFTKIDDLAKTLLGLTPEEALRLKEKGLILHRASVLPDRVLYIFVGWIVAERSMQKAQLVTQVRKSVFVSVGGQSKSVYKGAVDLLQLAGHTVEKMNIVQGILDET